jgi:hypothetical protein
MDIKRKKELIQELAPEIRGTKIEAAFLSTYANNYVPMWEYAAKPLKQVAKERLEFNNRPQLVNKRVEQYGVVPVCNPKHGK